MKRFLFVAILTAACALTLPAEDGWVSMFNGKDLTGWKANENAGSWKVVDGAIVGHGERSHLFWMTEECGNCEFKATVKVGKGSNSGMYFRAKFMEGWPLSYEAQVNTSHSDPVKTGSLYNFVKVFDKLVPEEEWFTQHIIADGNHIIIKVNGKTTVDFVDEKNSFTKGYLALQQHDPGSTVMYKDLMFRPIQK